MHHSILTPQTSSEKGSAKKEKKEMNEKKKNEKLSKENESATGKVGKYNTF